MDLCRGARSILTYAKLGRFIIIGFVSEPNPHQWKRTKVHATAGFVEPNRYVVPAALGGYLNEKAREMHQSANRLSGRQRERIASSFRADPDRLVGSDAFSAMQADVEMFGDQAFGRGESDGEP